MANLAIKIIDMYGMVHIAVLLTLMTLVASGQFFICITLNYFLTATMEFTAGMTIHALEPSLFQMDIRLCARCNSHIGVTTS